MHAIDRGGLARTEPEAFDEADASQRACSESLDRCSRWVSSNVADAGGAASEGELDSVANGVIDAFWG